MDFQMPEEIYIGRNVVKEHLIELYHRASTQGLLAGDEKILAVFDCIILDSGGVHQGGLSLHDYAVLTDQNLITWSRGRHHEKVNRQYWADISLEKWGARSAFEGVIKYVYISRPPKPKNKIKLRPPTVEKAGTAGPVEIAAEQTRNEFYLDFIPLEELEICTRMFRYLSEKGNETGTSTNFSQAFISEIEESQKRFNSTQEQSRTSESVAKNHSVAAKQVSSENGQVTNQTNYRVRKGYASPYKLAEASQGRIPEKTAFYPSTRSGNLNRNGNPLLNGKYGYYQGQSKLADFEMEPVTASIELKKAEEAVQQNITVQHQSNGTGSITKLVNTMQVAGDETGKPEEHAAGSSERNRLTTEDDTQYLYNFNRMINWVTPQNVGHSLSDISETTGILVNLAEVVLKDEEARQVALNRLRFKLEGGEMNSNFVVRFAVMPVMKRIMGLPQTAPAPQKPVKSNRVSLKPAKK